MNITIHNDTTILANVDENLRDALRKELSFVDKSKQYQLKRLSKSVWGKNSPQAAKLKTEIHQCLLSENPNGTLSFPSGLSGSFPDILSGFSINDQRYETGTKIALPWAEKPNTMRDYQDEAHTLMVDNWRGLINFATGLGKTLTATYAIRSIGRNTLIVCPNKSIAEQFYGILVKSFGKHRVGFFGDGRHSIKDLTVGIAPSVMNHIAEFKKADLGFLLFDEVHHIAADTFFTIANELGTVGRVFGLTATDFRNDGKDLLITAGCGPTLIRRDAKWGIEHGWLAKPYFLVREVLTLGKNYKDDKLKNYKAHVLNSAEMKTQIESDIRKFIQSGKRTLILVDEVAHGQELATNLNIAFATGEDKNSQSYIDAFNDKKIMGLVATDGKVGEGVDTRPVEVLVIANFVASKGAVLQAIGRGLRKIDGKETVIILDYVPMGSDMLKRHAYQRVEYYQELTDKVKVIEC